MAFSGSGSVPAPSATTRKQETQPDFPTAVARNATPCASTIPSVQCADKTDEAPIMRTYVLAKASGLFAHGGPAQSLILQSKEIDK